MNLSLLPLLGGLEGRFFLILLFFLVLRVLFFFLFFYNFLLILSSIVILIIIVVVVVVVIVIVIIPIFIVFLFLSIFFPSCRASCRCFFVAVVGAIAVVVTPAILGGEFLLTFSKASISILIIVLITIFSICCNWLRLALVLIIPFAC